MTRCEACSLPSNDCRKDSNGVVLCNACTENYREIARYQDRLLGDQLTAQIHSGGAARPSKLKPQQQKGLFEQTADTLSLFPH